MMTICDFPDDLIGEILSRVPITSLSALRSTCKRWNDLSKTHLFGKRAASNQQFLGFMLVNHKVCSLRFSFQGIINKEEIFVDPSMKKIRKLEDVLITQVSQCDGLLLCVLINNSCLLVWNPYLGQTRWIQPTRNTFMSYNSYALGYDDNCNHKILRFLYNIWDPETGEEHGKCQIEVYDLRSNAWRVLKVNHDWEEPNYLTGVSLKGNTYFLGRKVTHSENHLLCFDFTTERFGLRLSLPYNKPLDYTVDNEILSCIRDEKLVILYNQYERVKIWISTKIEANAISWSMFFKVERDNVPCVFLHQFGGSTMFFVDEEKKVAVLSRERTYEKDDRRLCIIGEDDRLGKYVNTGEAMKGFWDYSNLVGSFYVPSLVQLKVHQQETKH